MAMAVLWSLSEQKQMHCSVFHSDRQAINIVQRSVRWQQLYMPSDEPG